MTPQILMTIAQLCLLPNGLVEGIKLTQLRSVQMTCQKHYIRCAITGAEALNPRYNESDLVKALTTCVLNNR